MDRHFDYSQKILLAVEFGTAPRRMEGMPESYAVFQRMSIPAVEKAFDESHNLMVQLLAGRKFRGVLERHMGYWEQRVPAGKDCFVHYAVGSERAIAGVYDRLKGISGEFVMLGTFHVEAQSSAYPFAFPSGPVADHWFHGEERTLTKDSIYWFNFFPGQPYLFEKTFVVWALFQTLHLQGRGECNQLVTWDGMERLVSNGVADFVQVNLNRFTSLPAFFNSAHEAGRHTFTVDPDYHWYGMLMHKL